MINTFRKGTYFLALVAIFSSCSGGTSVKTASESVKPNIIYILADDMGYGDPSCYGQTKFQTPNIDRLAEGGMKFTQHYSGAAVCAPARSTLMTGLHTGHTPIRGNKELKTEGQSPMPTSYITVAEVLKEAGYSTGAFGKWGLGFIGSEGDANKQGFDTFFGYNCQRMAHRYYPPYLWHNSDTVWLEGNDWTNTVTYAPDVIHNEVLKFIEDNKNQPFFAYYPIVQPHAELIAPDDSILAKFKGKFEEVPHLVTNSYTSDYGPDIKQDEYTSQEMPYAMFAAMNVRIDLYVGQVVAKLKELGIEDNTIVIFTSDNGPAKEGGANPEYFNSNGGLRGVKRDFYEGGVRAPFIAYWPDKIKAGSVSDHVSIFYDMLPTLADIAGTDTPEELDGISFLPTLLSEKGQEKHDYIYWETPSNGGRQAIRMGDWKGVIYKLRDKNQKVELYNLAQDITESKDVASENPEIVKQLVALMTNAHSDSDVFPLPGIPVSERY